MTRQLTYHFWCQIHSRCSPGTLNRPTLNVAREFRKSSSQNTDSYARMAHRPQNYWGDNFQEATKKLETIKGNLTVSAGHFLGKKGGDRNQWSSHKFKKQNQGYNYKQHQKGSRYNNYINKQQQQGPAKQLQEKESTIFKKIDLVGSSNPFVPLSFPEYSGKSDKNSEVYESFNLENTPDNFVAGKTKFFKRNWFKITNNNFIRNTICGYELEMDDLPTQNTIPKPINFSPDEQDRIDQEINRFLHCKIIEKSK